MGGVVPTTGFNVAILSKSVMVAGCENRICERLILAAAEVAGRRDVGRLGDVGRRCRSARLDGVRKIRRRIHSRVR